VVTYVSEEPSDSILREKHGQTFREPTETELQLRVMKRKDCSSIRKSWKPLSHTLKEGKKVVSEDKACSSI
jgi:hypothetical protein